MTPGEACITAASSSDNVKTQASNYKSPKDKNHIVPSQRKNIYIIIFQYNWFPLQSCDFIHLKTMFGDIKKIYAPQCS